MKKFLLSITAFLLIFTLTACAATSAATSGNVPATEPKTEQVTIVSVQQITSNEAGTYTVEEVWLERDGLRIYGELYLPAQNGRLPLVILSHGFGGNHTYTEGYAKVLAENGIAAYAFDFIGGGAGSKSDGKIAEMSVLTEAADLNAVIDGLLLREDVDPSEVYLLGGSQGGFVSTYVAGTRPADIKGLIALYPAYVLQDDAWERTPDPDNIPVTMNLMGTTIGRIYNEDAMSFDIYDVMRDYPGDVLIIHGTRDNIAPIRYSERAVSTFSSAELIRFDGAGHGFYGSDETQAAELAVSFVKRHLGIENEERVDAVSSATLNIDSLPEVRADGNSHILVAYFSPNDTIRAVALTAADVLGADLFEIVPVEPYSEDDMNYHRQGNRAGEEQRSGARPAIVSLPDNIDQYDTILLGYPIWGGQAPNILYTFLESIELHDATVLPFCTSNMVSPGTSATNLQALTDETVTWLPAQRIANKSTEEELYAWARSLEVQETGKEKETETGGTQTMQLTIGDTPVSVTWEENASVEELKRMAAESPITVAMSMYGGFEQVGSLGTVLPRDDRQTTTSAGDIVLYAGNQIVVFYGSNSWAYTRLGKIDGLSSSELADLLGNGSAELILFTE